MSKIKLDDIKTELAQYGWSILSQTYKNLDSELQFQCDHGHAVFSTWKKIREHRVCPVCQQEEFQKISTRIIPKTPGQNRVLALDQSSYISGYSVYDGKTLIYYGAFSATSNNEIGRDTEVKRWLLNMIESWHPDAVALEDIQLQNTVGGTSARDADNIQGITTYKILARLQGILLNLLYEKNIKAIICHSGVWRKYCGINGRSRSDKKMATRILVKDWFQIDPTEDEADAICLGWYALTQMQDSKIHTFDD